MSDLTIECPKCRHPFELTEALAGPMLEAERRKAVAEADQHFATNAKAMAEEAVKKARAESEGVIEEMARQRKSDEAEVAKAREAELAARRAKQEADDAKRGVEVEVERRVVERAAAAAEYAREEAARQYAAELESVRSQIAVQGEKLAEAQEAEVAARRATREAEEAKREVEVQVERRVDEKSKSVREQALKERDDEYRLKIQEKERQLSDLKEKLDEAQRQADLGSQQLKGDVLEVDLCDALSSAFPGDEFERVKKGQNGGDLIHTVRSSSGQVSGRIKWESKHTQNWSDTWLPKLREDQRAAKCDLAALMTDVLPDGVAHFDVIEGVWVSSIATAVPMAAALRRGLVETATARRAAAGADSHKDQVYGYLTGPEFRARVQGVVEPVVQMRTSLESEKRAAARQFASRDKQIDRVVTSLAGMYGDLQGMVGPSLPTVPGLAAPETDGEVLLDTKAASTGKGEDAGDNQVH